MNVQPGRYNTLDNGGHPFSVVVSADGKVVVWQSGGGRKRPYLSFQASAIFLGKSPRNEMTEFSAGWLGGEADDGNSVLLQNVKDRANNEYYFVGWEIYKFRALAPIIYYTSPIGNSAVSYPWAQDALGNFYIIHDEVILTKSQALLPVDAPDAVKDQFDPYDTYWFDERPDGSKGLREFSCEHPLTKKLYHFDWYPDPENHFDHLTRPDIREMRSHMKETASLELGKQIWSSTIKIYGEQAGLKKMEITERVEGRLM